jgi:hypothetical protein
MAIHAARVGRSAAMRELPSIAASERAGRVELDRGAAVREWFSQDTRGLEHGVHLGARPAGEGDSLVEIATDGRAPVSRDTPSPSRSTRTARAAKSPPSA